MAVDKNNSDKINESKKRDYTAELKEKKKTEDELNKYTWAQKKKYQQEMKSLEIAAAGEQAAYEYEEKKKAQEQLHEQALKNAQAQGKTLEVLYEKYFSEEALGETVNKAVGSITSKLDSYIDNYIEKQESMTAHLIGTGAGGSNKSLSDIVDQLQDALSTTSLVRQEAVYNNLSKLVSSGIVYNVEQRAFLETIAEDIDAAFRSSDSALNRLIRLQGETVASELSSSRLSLEYSLQKFLNQNYQTSEYIKEAMSNVSSSLIEMQSLMSAKQAMGVETELQTWLGSLYSVGMSDDVVNSIAQAINDIGSGNVSGLGDGIYNLILMGASKANIDISDILNNSITQRQTDNLMQGVVDYLAEINSYSSNVVKSQMASLFGVNVSDIVAASQLTTGTGTVSTDINSTLFKDLNKLVPATTQVMNVLENMMYSWGTNIASNNLSLLSYKAEEMIANTLGDALKGTTITVGALGNGVELNLGDIAKAAPLLTLVPTLIQTLTGDIIPSLFKGAGGVTTIYQALQSSENLGGTFKLSSEGVSGSAYMSTTSKNDLLSNSVNSMNEEANSVKTVENEGPSLEDNVMTITDTLTDMYDLLDSMKSTINTISTKMPTTSAVNSSTNILSAAW